MTIPEIVLSEEDLDAIDEMKAKDAVTVMALPTRLDAHGSRIFFEDDDGPHMTEGELPMGGTPGGPRTLINVDRD